MNRLALVWVATILLLAPPDGHLHGVVFAQEKGSSQLEADFEREANPKRRVKLAVEILNETLRQLRSAYDKQDLDKETAAMESYLAAVDRVENTVKETSSIGIDKYAEIHMRQQAKALENLRTSLSIEERPAIEKAAARVNKLQEELLYLTVNPRKKEAKQ